MKASFLCYRFSLFLQSPWHGYLNYIIYFPQAHAWETAEVNTTNTATQLLAIVEDVSIQSDAVQCLSYLASPGALLMAELPSSNQP